MSVEDNNMKIISRIHTAILESEEKIKNFTDSIRIEMDSIKRLLSEIKAVTNDGVSVSTTDVQSNIIAVKDFKELIIKNLTTIPFSNYNGDIRNLGHTLPGFEALCGWPNGFYTNGVTKDRQLLLIFEYFIICIDGLPNKDFYFHILVKSMDLNSADIILFTEQDMTESFMLEVTKRVSLYFDSYKRSFYSKTNEGVIE